MLQTPFGPIGPGWMTTPSPGLPWPTTSIGTIGSLYGSAQPGGFTSTLEGGAPGAPQMAGQAQASGMAFGSSPLGWGMSPAALSTAFSIPDGVTASSLLMGIALRRGQPQGPTSDQDVEEFIYDALELLAGASDVEVRCEGGRVTLTGTVPHKRLKRDVGEIGWAIPGINDVQNNIGITTRRRSRAFTREPEPQQSGGTSRKQS